MCSLTTTRAPSRAGPAEQAAQPVSGGTIADAGALARRSRGSGFGPFGHAQNVVLDAICSEAELPFRFGQRPRQSRRKRQGAKP